MSLPPGFLDELRSRSSIAQVVGRKVIWDMRKSNQAKGDMWAPCPFHQEKSASFHVDDRKGYYYCFGCHAKGDALSFVRETENVSFMEAVEILAREAGMQMPARDPMAQEKADLRTELANVMEEAVKYFRLHLNTQAGTAARDYLAGRSLNKPAIDRFEIGFAPPGWQGLRDALKAKGISDDLIKGAGLAKESQKGREPFDVFRNRIIFPIRDPRGRCIAFGGRAMDPNDPAKYLNSPETALFDKGRSLYNHGPAREACGKGAPLVVCEGYMDVIAMVEGGFGGAVAPLGTAITEDQLRLMWRIHDEPIIALDGDTAGLRAALRVIDLALPLLEAGKGVRFAIMPPGLDPDDVIRKQGREAMETILSEAKPMVSLLWQRETEGKVFDSPERRAALDKSLRAAISRIQDPSIRGHYGDEIKRLRWELFGTGPQGGPQGHSPGGAQPSRGGFIPGGFGSGGKRGKGRFGAPPPALPETRSSLLATAPNDVAEHLREAMILGICVTHPALIAEFEAELEAVPLRDETHDRLRHRMLMHVAAPAPEIAKNLYAEMAADLEKLLNLPHLRSAPPVRNAENLDLARMCLTEELAKLDAARAVREEVADAMEDLAGLADEGVTWRLAQAASLRHRAERSKLEDSSDMGEDQAALSATLQAMIDGEIWRKKQ
ncbi:DNA primase [Thioclava nitratireducens]|uniref:DNA primase n=1 Tax=Thioclava nitratireducens TaxID=1915078 RepID=A0ABM6IJT0_9RHOB|nr:DNA primase [Thioclava nitratireducens]AQS49090.1 DNA primase [Thioclava nitratireducens]